MSFDKLVEEKIREAMANGEFDNLPGKGKPLDLDAYFAAPEDMRVAYSMLKNAGFVPEEMELLKEMDSLKAALAKSSDEDERKRIKKRIDEGTIRFNMLVERRKGKRR
jgi:DnaJ homologue, subfamily C, member 28, conserved domain